MTNFSIKYNSEAEHFEFSKNGKKLIAQGSKFANIQNKPWDFIMEKQRSFNWDGLVEEVIKQCNDREIDLTFQGKQNDFKNLENAVSLYQGSTIIHLHFEAAPPDNPVILDKDDRAGEQPELNNELTSSFGFCRNPTMSFSSDKSQEIKDSKKDLPKITNQSKETTTVTDFSIKYNPYLVECEFKKNGNEMTAKNSKFSEMRNKRLQFILGEHKAQGWRGLPQEIAATCNDNVINLEFQGRKIDYDDLMYAIKKYQEDCKGNNQRPAEFNVTFSESKNDNDIITELDKIIDEIKKKNLPQFNKKNKKGKTIFDAYKEAKDGMLNVSVIATMSSGKSTLINSLLHRELLPSLNQACTATVATILDNDDMNNYEATCYDANDNVIYPRKEINAEIMSEYNSDKKVQTIAIEGSIPAIPSDKIRLCLRDTPGPNNSRDDHHKELTESIIKCNTNSIVVYVMNATQMEINDDKILFESISREMKKEGKQSHDRFIFVINKCDALDPDKGETIPDLLDKARDYLRQFDITDPILIPTNSLLALTIRKKLNGQALTRSENKKYNDVDDYVEYEDLHYEDFAVLTPSVYDTLKRKVAEYHANEDDWDYEALIHTGVPALEETITEYVEKYAYPIKINDAVKDILAIFDEIGMKADFEKSVIEDNQQLSRVQKQIEDARQKRRKSQAKTENLKKRIGGFTLSLNAMDEKLKAETELDEMSEPYDNYIKVDKTDADNMIYSFQQTLANYQRSCANRLYRDINDNLFNLGEKIIQEYKNEIKYILGDIHIDGYDFRKISSFNEFDVDNIDEIIQRNESDKIQTITEWEENPNKFFRKRLFGIKVPKPWKLFESDYISHEKEVKVGTYVDVKAVISAILSQFLTKLNPEIDDMFDQANAQVFSYQRIFNSNLYELDKEIDRILNQLQADMANYDMIEARLSENQKMYEWTEKMEKSINSLLNF